MGFCNNPDGWGPNRGYRLTLCATGILIVTPMVILSFIALYFSMRSLRRNLDKRVRVNAKALSQSLNARGAAHYSLDITGEEKVIRGGYARMADDDQHYGRDKNNSKQQPSSMKNQQQQKQNHHKFLDQTSEMIDTKSADELALNETYRSTLRQMKLISNPSSKLLPLGDFSFLIQLLLAVMFLILLVICIYEAQSNEKKNNYAIWILSWETLLWSAMVIAYLYERKMYLIYCSVEFPSSTVRWIWVSQFGLAVYITEALSDRTISKHGFPDDPYQWIAINSLILSMTLTLQALLQSPKLPLNVEIHPEQITKEDRCGLYGILTFGWMSSMFSIGYARPLEMDDLKFLRMTDMTKSLLNEFSIAWRKRVDVIAIHAKPKSNVSYNIAGDNGQRKSRLSFSLPGSSKKRRDSNASNDALIITSATNTNLSGQNNNQGLKKESYTRELVGALWEAFGYTLTTALPMKLVYDCTQFSGPVFLSVFISYSDHFKDRPHAEHMGYVVAAFMFAIYMIGTFILHQYFQRAFVSGMRIRGALMAACFEKTLKLTATARSQKSSGEIMTMITVDIRKVRDVFPYLIILISGPFQICLALFLLYQQIGWSVFIGLAMQILLMGPVQGFVATKSRQLQKEVQKIRDLRMKVVNEMFGSMKIVKMYAWEMSFGDKIKGIRDEELTVLRCYVWYQVVTTLLWGWAQTLVTMTTFVAFTAAGHTLTPEKAFTSLALFNLLRFPLAVVPMVIASVIESSVSVKRIADYLVCSEIDDSLIQRIDPATVQDSAVLSAAQDSGGIGNNLFDKNTMIAISGNYSWDDECMQRALADLNVRFQKGTMSMIIGETGSGKSALIQAMLGEVNQVDGALQYCKDVSVSYSTQVSWIQNATLKDNILFGQPFDEEKYWKVIDVCALRSDLEILADGDLTEIGAKGVNLSGGQKQRVALARAVYTDCDVMIFDDPLSAVDSHVANHIFHECMLGYLKERGKTVILATHAVSFLKFADNVIVMNEGSVQMQGVLQDLIEADINLTKFVLASKEEGSDEENTEEEKVADGLASPRGLTRQSSTDSNASSKEEEQQRAMKKKREEDKAKGTGDKGKLIDEEERAIGDIDWKIFKLYMEASGGVGLTAVLLGFMILYIFAGVGATFFMGVWSNDDDTSQSKSWDYLGVYCAIQFLSLICLLLGMVVALVTRMKASHVLHNQLLNRMLHAPMSFFDTTPVGRLINRFARDVFAVDSAVPNSWVSALRVFLWCFSTVASVVIVTPYFMVALVPLAVFYWWVQKYFIASSRALRRLSSLMNSPIYSHFSETIDGVSIIRAFGRSLSFIDKNQSMVDSDHQAYYPSISANRWLAIRLECIGNILVFVAAVSCVFSHPSPGWVGVALSTVMSVTQGLNWFVRQKSQLEQDIVAVERLDQYNDVAQEKPYQIEETAPPRGWPNDGSISFKNVVMRYRPGLDPVLRGLSFEIEGRNKVGVIGRTGAGKSSIFLTLLRLVEIDEGQITIDGVDISQLGLQQLRSRLSIIPQESTLFTGSLRFNLDPFEECTDLELIEALRMAHIWSALITMARQESIKQAKKKEKAAKEEAEKKAEAESRKQKGKDKDAEDLSVNAPKRSAKQSLLGAAAVSDRGSVSVYSSFSDMSEASRTELMNSPYYTEIQPLELEIEENGANFSVGQRQLICLARAIVRKSQVLLLDEATSAVDPATDQMIQRTIRQVFADRTVLTIAHRIDTILDYDRILIVDKGTVLEYDSPQNLLSNPQSKFSEIVEQSFGVHLDDVIASKDGLTGGFGAESEDGSAPVISSAAAE